MEHKPEEIKEIEVSGKHIVLRVVLLVLAFAVAITAFAVGFRELSNREPGYYEIEAARDETAPLYANGFHLYCYFDGKSGEIKQNITDATALYTESMGRIYRLLDAYQTYEGYVNLATVNRNPNTVQKVPVELYSVLSDVSLQFEQYDLNLYDGILRSNWESIRISEDPMAYDPLYNGDSAERISRLYSLVSEPDAISLELIDPAEYAVELKVSDAFQSALNEMEEAGPVLELGLLREAYTLVYVAGKLNSAGFTRGYLTTDSGLTVMLQDTEATSMPVYTYDVGQPKELARISLMGGTSACELRSFPFDGERGYYTAEGLLRHPNLSEGEPNRTILTVAAVSDEDNIVTLCMQSIKLYSAENGIPEIIEKYTKSPIGWITADDPMEFRATEEMIQRTEIILTNGADISSAQ